MIAILALCALLADLRFPVCPTGGANEFSGIDVAYRQVVMVGEMHGTNEAPSALLKMACAILDKEANSKVTIFVEHPESDQGALDGVLSSSPDKEPWNLLRLLEDTSWVAEWQDGRNSEAMLILITNLNELRSLGYALDVVAIDRPVGSKEDRDAHMAAAILEEVNRGNGERRKFLSLTGNYHNAERNGESTADRLRKAGVSVLTLRTSASGGSAWQCTDTCGVKILQDIEQDDINGIFVGNVPGGKYDGIVFIGRQTPSMPALAVLKNQTSP